MGHVEVQTHTLQLMNWSVENVDQENKRRRKQMNKEKDMFEGMGKLKKNILDEEFGNLKLGKDEEEEKEKKEEVEEDDKDVQEL